MQNQTSIIEAKMELRQLFVRNARYGVHETYPEHANGVLYHTIPSADEEPPHDVALDGMARVGKAARSRPKSRPDLGQHGNFVSEVVYPVGRDIKSFLVESPNR